MLLSGVSLCRSADSSVRFFHAIQRHQRPAMSLHGSSKNLRAKKNPPLTHFLCLPLVTAASQPYLEASLQTFRADVSSTSPDDITAASETPSEVAIPSKAIRPVGTLHCTLGVMSLDQGRLVEAIELLKSPEVMKQFHDQAKDSSGESSPLKIDLKGLVSMHAPQSTSILYAEPIDASQRLHSFCVSLQELFRSKGFLVPDSRPLKLHATIINTIYAKGNTKKPARQKFDSSDPGAAAGKLDDRSRGHGPNAKAPIKLDALSVIEKYKGYVWAEDFALDRIAICEMGAKKVLDIQGNIVEERYTEVAHVNLPT